LRSPANDSAFDLNFDCGQPAVKRSDNPGLGQLKLESIGISVSRSTSGTIGLPAGTHVLGINYEGAIIARSVNQSRVIIVPPRSVFYVRGPIRLNSLVARGDHKLQMLSWNAAMLPALDQWIQNTGPVRQSKGQYRFVGCKPIDPNFSEPLRRFEEARKQQSELAEPLFMSFIYEAVGRIMVGGDEMQLSPLPADLPEPIQRLTEAVRQNPARSWSLKEASDMASYSPFHFSRVFKQLVSYGFHEYVDRCRTEMAVGLLVSSDKAVDIVAAQSGFGTTQGLRESVREYLGLVPSEFRSLPEGYETVGS